MQLAIRQVCLMFASVFRYALVFRCSFSEVILRHSYICVLFVTPSSRKAEVEGTNLERDFSPIKNNLNNNNTLFPFFQNHRQEEEALKPNLNCPRRLKRKELTAQTINVVQSQSDHIIFFY